MARLRSSGFEQNHARELDSSQSTFQSTTVRSGTYALNATSLTEDVYQRNYFQFSGSNANGPFYFRVYLRVATAPSAANRIIGLSSVTLGQMAYVTLDNSRVLRLYDEDGQITGTTTLSANTWYRIELKFDRTQAAGSHEVRLLVDGVEIAGSASRDITAGIGIFEFGGNLGSEFESTGSWFFDDVAINDSTGSFQNSYPGEGEVIHLRPNATGDNNQLGTGSVNNYQNVDEVSPDDATTEISMTADAAGDVDDYNLDAAPAAMDSTDTINCVQVGLRFRGGGSTDPIVVGIKASSGGTVEETGNLAASSSSYITNASSVPRNYPLTLYDLPGASTTAWTKADLDTAQVRVKLPTATQPFKPRFSTVWVLVDHKPAAVAAVRPSRLTLLGVG